MGHLVLARPHATLLAFLGTLLGARLAAFDGDWPTLLGIAVSNALLCGGSMIVNDCHDEPEDRINKPNRPVPAGRVGRTSAAVVGVGAFLAAILAAAVLSRPLGLAATAVTAASLLYTFRLKRIALVGNVVVAAIMAYPIWCWMLVSPRPSLPYLAFTTCCLVFFLGEEIIKLAEDVSGDRACGIATLATLRGADACTSLGVTLLAWGLLAAWLPVLVGVRSIVYLAGLAASLALVLALERRVRRHRAEQAPAVSPSRLLLHVRIIKVVMLLAAAFGLHSETFAPLLR